MSASRNDKLRCCRGFTLIELLITLTILGLLASLALPVSRTVIQRAHEQELRHALREIRDAIDMYKRAVDDGKIQKSALDSGYPKELRDLAIGITDQTDAKKRKLYFLRRVPRDPMNPDLTLAPEDSWGKRCLDSEPDDPQEGADVFDVYSRSVTVGLNGSPYNQW